MESERQGVRRESGDRSEVPIAKPDRPAGWPRSEDARRAVLDATHALLVEKGLASFSTEAVASRPGVARTSTHRWWPRQEPARDRKLPRRVGAASVIAQAQSEPAIRQTFREAFSEPLRQESAWLLEHGIEHGAFHADLDVPVVLDAAWSGVPSDTVLRGCLAEQPAP